MKKYKRDMKPFGEYIKIARQCENWTTRQAAEKLHLSKTYYNNLELGKVDRPKMEILNNIAAVYNLPLDEVVIRAGRIPQDVYYKLVDNIELLKLVRDLEV